MLHSVAGSGTTHVWWPETSRLTARKGERAQSSTRHPTGAAPATKDAPTDRLFKRAVILGPDRAAAWIDLCFSDLSKSGDRCDEREDAPGPCRMDDTVQKSGLTAFRSRKNEAQERGGNQSSYARYRVV